MKDSITKDQSEKTELVEMDADALDAVVGGVRVPEETFPVCPAPELA